MRISNIKPYNLGCMNISFKSREDKKKPMPKETVDYFVKHVPKEINEESRKRVFENFDSDRYAKVITHAAFRNGPVEDMHRNGQLSQEDMKTLNKYMVNKLAGILELVKNGEWLKIEMMIDMNKYFGTQWDKAEPDYETVDKMLKMKLEDA